MPPTPFVQHPSIIAIGVVEHRDDHTQIRGWTLGNCARKCPCHRHPLSGQLVAAQDQDAGTLGLCRFNPTSCTCCTPWTAAELDAVLADLYDVSTLETT